MDKVKQQLIDLIQPVLNCLPWGEVTRYTAADIAERLIANGVTLIPTDGIGEMSDGYHTFNELYHHRAVLFSVICNAMPDKAWKSKRHETGDMYDGMFIVGIETKRGQATYHYDIEPYWDMFNVPEIEYAPKWDGHTPQEAIERIANGVTVQDRGQWIVDAERLIATCSKCGKTLRFSDEMPIVLLYDNEHFCYNCGAKMGGDADG